jgi:EpsI family protein
LLSKHRLLLVNGVLILTLLGGWMGRKLEAATVADPKFLERLDLPFRGWDTKAQALTPTELDLLEPDAVLARQYSSRTSNQVAQLVIIAGHRKKSIHTPAYCMAGAGWETASRDTAAIRLADTTIHASRMLMMNSETKQRMLVTFFFTDGDFSTDSLPRFQAVELFKRFRSSVPVGALVRIEVPVTGSQEAAEKLSDEFAADVVPPVISELAKARLVSK